MLAELLPMHRPFRAWPAPTLECGRFALKRLGNDAARPTALRSQEDVAHAVGLSLGLMVQDQWHWFEPAIGNRDVFRNSNKPDGLPVEQEEAPIGPVFSSRPLAIPKRPDAGESGNGDIWRGCGPKLQKPLPHPVAGKFIRVKAQNPIVGSPFPGKSARAFHGAR